MPILETQTQMIYGISRQIEVKKCLTEAHVPYIL